MPTLQEILSGARGVISGGSVGLSKYPAAAMMLMMDQSGLTEQVKRGKLTWNEALTLLEEQQARDYAENPKATIAGNLAGAGALGLLTSGASTIPAAMAVNAGLGGVQGYTQKEDLTDAAIGAGVGAVAGGATKGIQTGVSKLAEKVTTQRLSAYIEKLLREKPKGYKQMLAEIMGETGDQKVVNAAKDFNKNVLRTMITEKKTPNSLEIGDLPQPVLDATRQISRPVLNHIGDVFDAVMRTGGGALTGYLGNEAIGATFGENAKFDPASALLVGGTAGGARALGSAGRELGKDVLTRVALKPTTTRLPVGLSSTGTILATRPVIEKFNPEFVPVPWGNEVLKPVAMPPAEPDFVPVPWGKQ